MDLLPRLVFFELADHLEFNVLLRLRELSWAMRGAVDAYVMQSARGRAYLKRRVALRIDGRKDPFWPSSRTYLDLCLARKFYPSSRYRLFWRLLRRSCPAKHCLFPVPPSQQPTSCPHNASYIIKLVNALKYEAGRLKENPSFRGLFDKGIVLLIKEEGRRRKCGQLIHACISLQQIWRRGIVYSSTR